MKETIYLIGAGAAGSAIACALNNAGRTIIGITDKNETAAERLAKRVVAPWTTAYDSAIGEADIVIVAVPDPMIETVAAEAVSGNVPAPHQIWLHLSGALTTAALAPLRNHVNAVGAFHPAHVFPKKEIAKLIPGTVFGIAGDPPALAAAEALAADLDGYTVHVSDDIRPRYHAATVLASNAVVALLAAARDALDTAGLNKEAAETLLITLAESAVESSALLGLTGALTGPIQRGDTAMVARHLTALEESPDVLELYMTLGRAIVRLAEKAGLTDVHALDAIRQLLVVK